MFSHDYLQFSCVLDKESNILTKCLELAENYEHDIDESEQVITEKCIQAQRCNLGKDLQWLVTFLLQTLYF